MNCLALNPFSEINEYMRFEINIGVKIMGLLTLLILASCARKGSPSGGPKDITPPILLKAKPDTLKTGVDTDLKKITLSFNEYVQLKDYQKNVIISPPLDPPPTFSPLGYPAKEVEISLNGKLKPNTTYTINFGDAIEDNNERNKLSYFSYVFSTGEFIDSLQVKGKAIYTASRKPLENVIVALYKLDSAYSDSLILKQKPYYVTKVDSASQFNLNHLSEGNYKMFAIQDETPNMLFDAGTEKIAFLKDTINPKEDIRYDLNLFQPEKPYKVVEAKQNDYGRFDIIFEGNPKQVNAEPIGVNIASAKIIHKPYSDTLQYYFNPEQNLSNEKRPRVQFVVEHEQQKDTLFPTSYDVKTEHQLKVSGVNRNYVPSKLYELVSNYPVDSVNPNFIQIKKDSVVLDFEVEKKNEKNIVLNFPIQYEQKYNIELLPGAITDFFGKTNDTINLGFGVKSERDYGNLTLTLENAPSHPYWIKLFTDKDQEINSYYGNDTTLPLKGLLPGKYYFQLWVDENENGRYDTGNVFTGRQPERIITYPKSIEVRAFWDLNETWKLNE